MVYIFDVTFFLLSIKDFTKPHTIINSHSKGTTFMTYNLYQTAIHSIISVSILFILARVMGKKQIAQLTFFDYIISISIGSIAAQTAVDPSIHFSDGTLALIIFALFSLVLSFISTRSYIGRKLLDGTPTILIEKGKIIEKGLKETKLTVNDLLEECRQKDAFNIADIEFAILETSGKLSVLLKHSKQPLTPEDMNISIKNQGLCINIIIDGKIISKHLSMIGKDINWLNQELEKQNMKEYKDILLAYVDVMGVLTVIHKNVNTSISSI